MSARVITWLRARRTVQAAAAARRRRVPILSPAELQAALDADLIEPCTVITRDGRPLKAYRPTDKARSMP